AISSRSRSSSSSSRVNCLAACSAPWPDRAFARCAGNSAYFRTVRRCASESFRSDRSSVKPSCRPGFSARLLVRAIGLIPLLDLVMPKPLVQLQTGGTVGGDLGHSRLLSELGRKGHHVTPGP